MKRLDLSRPTLGFIAATRGALGVGIGLLVAEKLPRSRRRQIGVSLLVLGILTTIPAAYAVFGEDLVARWKKLKAAA